MMDFDATFDAAFKAGVTDIGFCVRRDVAASSEDLRREAMLFQTAIAEGRVVEVEGVD